MPKASHPSLPSLQSVNESPFTAGYVVAEDGDETEQARARTVFVTIEPDGLSAYSCMGIKDIVADPKSLALLQRLNKFNYSSHLPWEQRTKQSEAATANASAGALRVDIIDHEGIKEFIDRPPTSGTQGSDFHKFVPHEWMELMRAGTASARQLTRAGLSTEGRVRNSSGVPGARLAPSASSISGTTLRPNSQPSKSVGAGSVSWSTASVAPGLSETATIQDARNSGVEVDMEDAGLGTSDAGSHSATVGGDPMEIDMDSDVEMADV